MVAPRLADVKAQRIRFQPGDRVLVRSNTRLDVEAQRKLRKAICKWAGCEVEVLIYCALDLDIQVENIPSLVKP